MKSRGFLYIATGLEKFTFEAIRSAQSMRKYWPEVEITLFTDAWHYKAFTGYKIFNDVKVSGKVTPSLDWRHHLTNKVHGVLNTPYDITAFIDTDTLIKSVHIREVFDLLKDAEIAIRPANRETSRSAALFSAQMFYTGFFVYDSTSVAVKQLLQNWLKEQSANIAKLEAGDVHDVNCIEGTSEADKEFLLGTSQYSLAQYLRPDFTPDGLRVRQLGPEWNYHSLEDRQDIIVDTKPFQKFRYFSENHFGHFRPFNISVAETFVGLSMSERKHVLDMALESKGSQEKCENFFSESGSGLKSLGQIVHQHACALIESVYPGRISGKGNDELRLRTQIEVFDAGELPHLSVVSDALLSGFYWISVPENSQSWPNGLTMELFNPIFSANSVRFTAAGKNGGCTISAQNDKLVLYPSGLQVSLSPTTAQGQRVCLILQVF